MMKKPVVAAVLAVSALGAFAADPVISFVNKSSSSPIVRTSETGQVSLGILNYSDSIAGSFLAYCIEPSESNSVAARTYTASTFSGSQATLLQGLYSSTFASATSVTQQAAFQLAVWEIVRESPANSLSLTQNSGSFYVRTTGLTGVSLQNTNDLISLANSYLNAAQSYSGLPLYSLTKLTNAGAQDLVVAQAVPEPGTYTMFLAGLGAVGLIARRRLRR